MSDLCFTKVKSEFNYYLIVFERGEIGTPIAVFDTNDINKLNKEWKTKICLSSVCEMCGVVAKKDE